MTGSFGLLAEGGAGRVGEGCQSEMRGLATPVPVSAAGGRLSRNGRGRSRLPIGVSRVPADSRPGASLTSAAVPRALHGDRRRPEEAGQLARDGDGDHVLRLVPGAQARVQAVQAVLGAPGGLEDVPRLVLFGGG